MRDRVRRARREGSSGRRAVKPIRLPRRLFNPTGRDDRSPERRSLNTAGATLPPSPLIFLFFTMWAEKRLHPHPAPQPSLPRATSANNRAKGGRGVDLSLGRLPRVKKRAHLDDPRVKSRGAEIILRLSCRTHRARRSSLRESLCAVPCDTPHPPTVLHTSFQVATFFFKLFF